jgi:hypothetical protein
VASEVGYVSSTGLRKEPVFSYLPRQKHGMIPTTVMADEKISQLTSTIPELFYDVLARIFPGLALMAVTILGLVSFRFWILNRPVQTMWPLSSGSPILLAFVLSLGCWIAGLLLTPLGDWLWRNKQQDRCSLS